MFEVKIGDAFKGLTLSLGGNCNGNLFYSKATFGSVLYFSFIYQ